MSKRTLLPVIALAVFVAGFFGLRQVLDRDAGERNDALALGPGVEEAAPSAAPDSDLPGTAELSASGSERSIVSALAAPGGAEAFPLADARWIEGRVLFPLGAPLEPELAVVAIAEEVVVESTDEIPNWRGFGTDWRSSVENSERWSRRTIEPDGSFRVPLPADGRKARLYLDGRFLFLREPRDVDAESGERVELEAELGGALLVRVSPPRGIEGAAAEVANAEVELNGAKGGGFFGGMGGRGIGGLRRERELPAELELEFGGLPADFIYYLSVDPKVFLAARALEIELTAGQVAEVALELEPGATLAGRVTDDSGAPVQEARVSVDLQGQFAQMLGGGDRSARSGADGSFLLRGVQPRKLKLQADLDGFVDAESEELKPAQGQALRGLELVLRRGATIAGRVRYEDGAPAAEVSVHVLGTRRGSGEPVWDERTETKTDADGAFSQSGLSDEHEYEVTALAGEEGDHAGFRARANAVQPGTRDLALVLRAPEGLTGVVRSDAGEAIPKYTIRARLEQSDFGRLGSADENVDDPSGRFLLTGVFEGRWTITVDAQGWVTELEEVQADVPSQDAFEIVMVRAASLAGSVLDPTGAPAVEATVSLERGAASANRGGPFGGFGGRETTTETDAEGRFRFMSVRPGKVRLGASDEDWAPAPEQAIELVAGVEVSELALQLGLGGTLTGEVFDAEGEHEAGRTIVAFTMGSPGNGTRSATSDDAGHFMMEHLGPGSYTVMAQPRLGALAEMAESEEEPSPVDFMASMKMKTVAIVENQTTHVVLGEPPANPVRLFGRVTEGGKPVEKGSLMAVAEGRSIVEAWKPARIRTGGEYEIVLDEPGRYLLVYQTEAFQEGGIEFAVTVPEAEEHRFDVALPGGRIEGIVFGPDGAPLAGISVALTRDSGVRTGSMFSMGRRESSAEDGRFSFDRLEPATYSVRAGGQTFATPFGGNNGAEKLGTALVSDLLVVEGEVLGGVELRLERAGRLRGTVVGSDGEPVAGATIFVRDSAGRPVQTFATTSTDGDGRFDHAGLAPGEYTVSAQTAEAVSSRGASVRIREADDTEVELRVEDGVIVRVVAETPDGLPVRAKVSVVDEDGREYADLRSMASLQTEFTEGVSTTEIRVGPVPPGKYVVTVTAEDGEVEERTIALSASRSERKLRLRFGE